MTCATTTEQQTGACPRGAAVSSHGGSTEVTSGPRTAVTYSTGLTGDGVAVYRNDSGPCGPQHPRMEKRGRMAVRVANPPERFARALARALECDHQPIVHRGAGIDATVYRTVARILPTIAMHHLIRFGLGQPRFGTLRTVKEENTNSA